MRALSADRARRTWSVSSATVAACAVARVAAAAVAVVTASSRAAARARYWSTWPVSRPTPSLGAPRRSEGLGLGDVSEFGRAFVVGDPMTGKAGEPDGALLLGEPTLAVSEGEGEGVGVAESEGVLSEGDGAVAEGDGGTVSSARAAPAVEPSITAASGHREDRVAGEDMHAFISTP